MSELGWIALDRKIMNNWLWNEKPFSFGQAWVDMLLMANHKENKFPLGNEIVTVSRGSFITSEIKLMNRWGWSKSKLRRFLNLLISDEMIIKKSDRRKTTITIVKYSDFQDSQTTDRPIKDQQKTISRPIKDTNNNINNINNINNNKYSVHFESFWKAYPRKKEKAKAYKCYQARLKDGFSGEELLTAAVNYAEECEKRKTEERYIKHGATFLSASTPFVDYLDKEKPEEKPEEKPYSDWKEPDYYKYLGVNQTDGPFK